MAITIRGKSCCALCSEVLDAGQELFATSAFIEDQSHRFWRYSDASMHLTCFLAWPDRSDFIDEFNAYYSRHYRGMFFMHPDGTIDRRGPQSRGPA